MQLADYKDLFIRLKDGTDITHDATSDWDLPFKKVAKCSQRPKAVADDLTNREHGQLGSRQAEFHLCATESHPLTWTSPCEDWSLTSLKEKLIKIGAKVVRHGRYVIFQMAEVAIPRQMFQEILRLIAELRPQPPPAPA
jgi:hypothetical protein